MFYRAPVSVRGEERLAVGMFYSLSSSRVLILHSPTILLASGFTLSDYNSIQGLSRATALTSFIKRVRQRRKTFLSELLRKNLKATKMSYMAKAKIINCGFLLKFKPHFFVLLLETFLEKPTSALWSVLSYSP